MSTFNRAGIVLLSALFLTGLGLFHPDRTLAGWDDFDNVSPGRKFVGGSPPKLVGVEFNTRKPVLKNDKYHLKSYVVFRRSTLDDGSRRFPILRSSTYRQLLLPNNRELQWLVKACRPSKLNQRYPTFYAILDYTVKYQRQQGGYTNSNVGRYLKKKVLVYEKGWKNSWSLTRVMKKKWKTVRYFEKGRRTKHAPGLVGEFLVNGLTPGSYNLNLHVKADVDYNHIFGQLWWSVDWVRFLNSPIPGLSDVAEKVAISTATKTKSQWILHVPAVTPDLKSARIKRPSDAVREIRAWSLKPTPIKNKIKSQWPRPGTLLKKGQEVRFRYYAYQNPIPPQPLGRTLAFTNMQRSFKVSGQITGTGHDYQRYDFTTLDTRLFRNGGTLYMHVSLGNGESHASFDLYPQGAVIPTKGFPRTSVAKKYNVPSGKRFIMKYRFQKGQVFKFGATGNWNSRKGATNNYSVIFEIK